MKCMKYSEVIATLYLNYFSEIITLYIQGFKLHTSCTNRKLHMYRRTHYTHW
ncbi:hypothetical protein MNV_60015 [Candidatus Methanoperedens nitroreducens]|uniref:Uncharacterized protein n=1 Tax=Candidatus Methanoperedens nitratireducens TaxID=1392998 RepID=A0A284VS71_9EURY|nr:hypothetical protein MNV_60015 [Candidatus Methanoperedens nitroreducens]